MDAEACLCVGVGDDCWFEILPTERYQVGVGGVVGGGMVTGIGRMNKSHFLGCSFFTTAYLFGSREGREMFGFGRMRGRGVGGEGGGGGELRRFFREIVWGMGKKRYLCSAKETWWM